MIHKALYKVVWVLGAMSILLSACQPAAQEPKMNVQTQVALSAYQTLTAIANAKPTSTSTALPPTATATIDPATITAVGPTNFPANVNPLTGLPVLDPKILDRRPVLVKVSNFPRIGRPHAGLSAADIVFEYFIGEGTNRFIAVFYGQDAAKVGPIRSGRMVDAQIVPMYQGILAYSGAYVKVDQVIRKALDTRAIIGSPATCPGICDVGEHSVITVFSDTAKLTEYAIKNGISEATKPNLDGMRFDPAAPQTGDAATQLTIQFNALDRGEWRYDSASGKYLRWIEDDANQMIPLVDRNTNQQLAFSNVIVAFAQYIEYAPTMHDVTLAGNTQGQKAVLFRDGKAIEGIWKSGGADKPMQFFTSKGEALALKPGNSWVALMGLASTMQQSKPGTWDVQFDLP